MALQSVTPGSQEYRRNRTHAISHELKFLYSQPPPAIPEENESDDERDVRGVIPQTLGIAGLDMDSPEFRLGVYQNMCRKVNLEPRNTISACTYDLKHKILVNIYDFIDAQRLGGKLKLWQDFTEFSAYCLEPGKCMDLKVAKKDKFLKFLLQRLVRTKRSRPSRKLDLRKEKRKKRGNTPRTHSKRHRS